MGLGIYIGLTRLSLCFCSSPIQHSQPGELIRLKDIIELNFQLQGKPVVTASKEKLGKVNDYATETNTMYVQKLYVSQSILKSLSSGSLSVERTQIIEITNRKIIIQDPLQPTRAGVPATAPMPN